MDANFYTTYLTYTELKKYFDALGNKSETGSTDWEEMVYKNNRTHNKWISEIIPIMVYLSFELPDVGVKFLLPDYPDIDCILGKSGVEIEKIQITIAVNQYSHKYKKPQRKSKKRCKVASADIDDHSKKINELEQLLKKEDDSKNRQKINSEIDELKNQIYNQPIMMRSMDDIKKKQIEYIKDAIKNKINKQLNSDEDKGAILLVGYYADYTASFNKELDEFSLEELNDLKIFCQKESDSLSIKYNKVVIVNVSYMQYAESEKIKPEIIWIKHRNSWSGIPIST